MINFIEAHSKSKHVIETKKGGLTVNTGKKDQYTMVMGLEMDHVRAILYLWLKIELKVAILSHKP